MMTVEKHGFCLDGASAEAAAARLTQLGADALGCNCSCGPESVLDAIQRMRTATSLPLAAMPSAGLPCAIEGRNIYIVSRADMASCTHKLIHDGASLIGGCCGSTPDHIRAIQSVILACAECRVIAAQAGESGVALSSGEENRHGWI
jgi:homocysteine S-methyltransferase